jgi:hypothetical protein
MVGGFARGENAMVFKLTDQERRKAALALSGAHLFDPSGGRRKPMQEWVVVPTAHAKRWAALAEDALGR